MSKAYSPTRNWNPGVYSPGQTEEARAEKNSQQLTSSDENSKSLYDGLRTNKKPSSRPYADLEEVKLLTTSLDPRIVCAKMRDLRFIAKCETLHQRFFDMNGLTYLMTGLKRFMWNAGVCEEACFLLSFFMQNHDSHKALIGEECVDILFALVPSHAQTAVTDDQGVRILTLVAESLGSLACSAEQSTRQLVVAKGGERMAALMAEVILKENKDMSPVERSRLERAVKRLRSNLETLCGVHWDAKSARNKKYFLNKHVYMMTHCDKENPWKLPK